MTRVWPALWPPWNRTTTSARADSQSTIFPLPSSPHWAPITATLAMNHFQSKRKPTLECQSARLLHRGKGADFLENRIGHPFVHLHQSDGVGTWRAAAEIEIGDVHACIAEQCAEPADEAGFVLIGDVEHMGRELGLHVDALDLD